MTRFDVPAEVGKRIESAANELGISGAKWLELTVESALREQGKPTQNEYIRGTATPGERPRQPAKVDPAVVLSTIANARESLRHANANHSEHVTV